MDIDEILKKWDLTNKEIEEKQNILNKWKGSTTKEEQLVLEIICNNTLLLS